MGAQEDRQSVANWFATTISQTRSEAKTCAIYNMVLGVGLLIGTREQHRSLVFDPLKRMLEVLPGEAMNLWGVIVGSLGLALWLAVVNRSYRTYLVSIYALGVIWAIFAGVFVIGYGMRLGSIFGGVLAVGFARRHWVLARVKPWQIKG